MVSMTSGIAHELRNPLSIVNRGAEIVSKSSQELLLEFEKSFVTSKPDQYSEFIIGLPVAKKEF